MFIEAGQNSIGSSFRSGMFDVRNEIESTHDMPLLTELRFFCLWTINISPHRGLRVEC